MTSKHRLLALQVTSVVLIVVGGLATMWFAFADVFGGQAAVLCTDPEDWRCSGHYVHGVANEVWTIIVVAFGVAGLLVSRRTMRARKQASTTL